MSCNISLRFRGRNRNLGQQPFSAKAEWRNSCPVRVLTMFAQLFKIAFGVSLPIFSVLLISDVLLGVMSKMMPHMNIYMVALPVKIYIGLFLMMVFLSGTSSYLQGVIQNYFDAIVRIFT